MESKVSARQVGFVLIAVLGSLVVANYDKLLPVRWLTYNAPDGSFSVELPGQPKVETLQAPVEGGGTAPMTAISVQPTASAAYMCSYLDHDNLTARPPAETLAAARDGGLAKIEGTAISEKSFSVHGYPAVQIQARARGNSLADMQIVLVRRRLYFLMVVNTVANDREQKSVERMFNSFKIVKP